MTGYRMRWWCAGTLMMIILPLVHATGEEHSVPSRIGVSAGMGVNYHEARDIVDRINGSGITTQRVDDFTSAIEFFGAVSVPLSEDWVAKGEYVYMLASHSPGSVFGTATSEFTYIVHMPTLVAQYVLVGEPSYNFKAGLGVGFHFATYEEKFFAARYTGNGIGTLLELEGNTALGEDLYAHLGVQSRWDFIGTLKDSRGRSPFGNSVATALHFFSVGARLGMTYYF